jgi:hypothetical protein
VHWGWLYYCNDCFAAEIFADLIDAASAHPAWRADLCRMLRHAAARIMEMD